MYLGRPRQDLWQGDIFVGVPIVEVSGEERKDWRGKVIVLSHECELAKPSTRTALVVRIRGEADFNPDQWGHIKKNRLYNGMYLEGAGPHMPGFVDFRLIHRVRIDVLERCEKIASLTEEARQALPAYLWRFLTRRLPDTETDAPDQQD